jgi:hypothetical protein
MDSNEYHSKYKYLIGNIFFSLIQVGDWSNFKKITSLLEKTIEENIAIEPFWLMFWNDNLELQHKNLNNYAKINNYNISAKLELKKTDNKDLVFVVDDHTVNDYKNNKMNNSDKIDFEARTHIEKGIYVNFYRQNKIYELFNILCNIGSKIITGEIKIIFDEDLLVSLNKEGIELDDDYLQTLRDMLFSSDKSNVSLGFEMISNLVLNNHTILSISFLLNELYHTKGFRHSYYSSNSNLKSLLKLLNTKKIYWERDWKTFGTGLRLNFKDGKEGEVVKKFLLDNINREFKLSNSAAESLVDIVFTTEA